jgi:hypothetical protein
METVSMLYLEAGQRATIELDRVAPAQMDKSDFMDQAAPSPIETRPKFQPPSHFIEGAYREKARFLQ